MSDLSFPSISWEQFDRISPKFIDKIYIRVVTNYFGRFVTELFMTLDWCQNFFYAQYLENKLTEFHQILYMNMYSYQQDLAWDCYTSFLHICTRAMALDLRQNFVSAQYEQRISSDKASNLPKRDDRFILLK